MKRNASMNEMFKHLENTRGQKYRSITVRICAISVSEDCHAGGTAFHASTRLKKSSIMRRQSEHCPRAQTNTICERSVELACGLVSTICTKLITDRNGENCVKLRILERNDLREVVPPLNANIGRTVICAKWNAIGTPFHRFMGNKMLLGLTKNFGFDRRKREGHGGAIGQPVLANRTRISVW